MLTECKGIVVRQVPVTESSMMLTILTAEKGKISANAKGSRTIKSKQAAATQLFCYASFILYEKNEKYWVREADLIENFYGLREDIERIALASYVCDVASDIALEEMPEEVTLRLVLNSLYAISEGKSEMDKIKAAFEWRIAAQLGFEPDLIACAECGDIEIAALDIMDGAAYCKDCAKLHDFEKKAVITRSAADAARYVSECDLKKLIAFNLSPKELSVFALAGESYLLNHVERSFESLNFYKAVKS